MLKVYIEYKVISEKREAYLSLIKQAYKNDENTIDKFFLYEGVEQPNLFVEDIILLNSNKFNEFKKGRLQETGFWGDVHSCVEGGISKVRVYAFKNVH
ncbi:Uncharacterised protein [Bacillus freudenreichii]|nr:Uncharacterised protein [Bacillus freudenreichii]